MATHKTHDLAVKVGSYTDSNGETKNRYVNCGAIFQKDDGSEFFTINRTFNPAGVPNPDNKEMVVISRFEVKPREGQKPAPAPAPKPAAKSIQDMEDDIPF